MKSGKLWRGHSPVLGDPGQHSSGMGRHWMCQKEDHTDVEFPHVPGENCAAKLPTIDLPVRTQGGAGRSSALIAQIHSAVEGPGGGASK